MAFSQYIVIVKTFNWNFCCIFSIWFELASLLWIWIIRLLSTISTFQRKIMWKIFIYINFKIVFWFTIFLIWCAAWKSRIFSSIIPGLNITNLYSTEKSNKIRIEFGKIWRLCVETFFPSKMMQNVCICITIFSSQELLQQSNDV